jgi:hypothetical protein
VSRLGTDFGEEVTCRGAEKGVAWGQGSSDANWSEMIQWLEKGSWSKEGENGTSKERKRQRALMSFS